MVLIGGCGTREFCRTTTFTLMTYTHWAGGNQKLRLNTPQNKWFMEEYTETMKVYYRIRLVVYGLKQTLITTAASGTDIGCFGQMTG